MFRDKIRYVYENAVLVLLDAWTFYCLLRLLLTAH